MAADLIIGVDFGMTFTGVAYYVPEKTLPDQPKLLQKWPGKHDKTENKVPTSLIYHGRKLEAWGFQCDAPDQSDYSDPVRQQYFKLWLDRPHLKEVFPEAEGGPTHNDVKKWFTDFLTRLYTHIKQEFSHGPFKEEWRRKVEFVFSVPTTWKSHNVFDTYKQCIEKAGFGTGGKKHTFSIGLTEAEAAAIYTFKGKALKLHARDMILVCDAGGGTTDAALLEVVDQTKEIPQLKQYGVDYGKPIGSVNIDRAFKDLVQGRLQKIASKVPALSEDDPDWAANTAWEMTQGAFQALKCGFGTLEGIQGKFRIKIPDFPKSKEFSEVFIEKQHMRFTKRDMSKLFDSQLEGIYSTLDNQLQYLKTEKPSKQVNYLVLSGGLGSSRYIQDKITERYVNNSQQYPNTKHLKVFQADDPQTAVVQGLVLNQAQRHDSGSGVLESHNSPASYGVLRKELYDEDKHFGLETEEDELDGKIYAINLIHWFVKKGDSVSEKKPISYRFGRKLAPDIDLSRIPWKSTVVVCWKDRRFLPQALNDDTPILCKITSDASGLKLENFEKFTHRVRIWETAYYLAKYELKVNINLSDILFEVWCHGLKLSEDRPIRVQWKEGAEMMRPSDAGKVRDELLR